MPTFTLAVLRQRCQRLFEDEDAAYITSALWTDWINEGWAELHSLLTGAGIHYNLKTQTITASGVGDYALANDFGGVLLVQQKKTGVNPRPLQATLAMDSWRYHIGNEALAYVIWDAFITLMPPPPVGQTYQVLYNPRPNQLVDEDDTITCPLGLEQWVVLHAVIQARIREESGISELQKERATLEKRIQEMRAQQQLDALIRPLPTQGIAEAASRRPYRRP